MDGHSATGPAIRPAIRFIETEEDFIRSFPLLQSLMADQKQYDPGTVVPELEEALINYKKAVSVCGYKQIIAEFGGEVVAVAGLKPVYDPLDTQICYEINNLVVAPDHRRKGIGTAIMHWIRRYAEMHEGCYIRLMMFKGNETARPYYESLGYTAPCDMFLLELPAETRT